MDDQKVRDRANKVNAIKHELLEAIGDLVTIMANYPKVEELRERQRDIIRQKVVFLIDAATELGEAIGE